MRTALHGRPVHPFPTIQHSGVAGYAEAKIDPVIDEMLAAYHR
jgi:hypothetical protein